MTRYTFLASRVGLPASTSRICVRQDPTISIGGSTNAALLGCLPVPTEYGGGFRTTLGKQGVVVDGWIINPGTKAPVTVEIRRGTTSVRQTAKLRDNRSKGRWPEFETTHGFRIVIPFVGHGGTYHLCVATPGHVFSTTGDELAGCLDYQEKASMFIDNTTYTIGDTVHFSAEMLDSGASVRLNLFTSVDTFFLPWQVADIANLTADSAGHIEGQFSTSPAAPGTYRLALQCLSGCSQMTKYWPTQSQAFECCLSSPSGFSPVTLGPAFTVKSKSKGTAAKVFVKSRTTLRVQGTRLPANATLRPVVIVGGFQRQPNAFDYRFVDGLLHLELSEVKADATGRFKKDLTTLPLVPGRYLLWLVDDPGRALTSTPFEVTAATPLRSARSLAGGPRPDFSLPGHYAITKAALTPTVSASVLADIEGNFITGSGNLGSDLFQLDQWRHFDSAPHPVQVCDRANLAWLHFSGLILGDLRLGSLEAARSEFGGLSHAVQDFYSHSDWLEIGQRALAPLFPSCSPTSLPPSLETGYFGIAWDNTFPGGCPVDSTHSLAPPYPFTYCHQEINKDEPTGHGADPLPGGAGATYYSAAVSLAVQATAALVQNVKTFVTANITAVHDDLSGSCMADALFGLVPTTRTISSGLCLDLRGVWTSTGSTTTPGFGVGPWDVTNSSATVIAGERTTPSCGDLPFSGTEAPGFGIANFAGTYVTCIVDAETGLPATGACAVFHSLPLTINYVGAGRMLVTMTRGEFEEDEDAGTCTQVASSIEQLTLHR
jgi:hypothetical protein